MKKSFLTLLLGFSSFLGVIAQHHEKEISSAISQVNVYLNRAQINRFATANIETGVTDLVLTGLTPNIDVNSIQVNGKGNFILMSVKHQNEYLDKNNASDKAKSLQSQIDGLQLENRKLNSKKQVLQEEKELLLSNRTISGKKNGVSALELERSAMVFRTRRLDIDRLYLEYEVALNKNMTTIGDLQNQLNEVNRNKNTASSSIVVSVSSKTAQKIALNFDYMVYGAGWEPFYDIRATDGKDKVQLSYKAKIYQNTGIDWNNVTINVSTGNPAQGGTKPSLTAWYLQIYNPNNYPTSYGRKDAMPQAASSAYKLKESPKKEREKGGYDEPTSTSDYTTVEESDLAVTFNISLKQTIPSDNKKYTVDIQNFEINSSFTHAAVPKLDQDAFLLASLTDWEGLNLLSGNANVFYDGAYVGNTFLNLKNTTDTLDVSLGRDKKVIITREKIKNYCKTKTIGTNVKKIVGYEITVRNTKSRPVQLVLEDQLPISNNSTAEVTLIDIAGGNVDENTKKVIWEMALKPGETKKILLKFEVKYPKKMTVSNL